ncbi:MAG: DedA family protein [Candidatus Kerfeldbacteria bacterium]|nr:DedA family protein [Candidatus Kerfeldbacteria bacterium]
MVDIVHQFTSWVLQLVEGLRFLAYTLVFLATFFESLPLLGLVIPGALVVLFGGFLVSHGSADLGDMIFFATLGAVLGDWLGYVVGRLLRLVNFVAPLDRFTSFRRAQNYFKTRGGWNLIYGRFLAPLRGFIPVLAGLGRMEHGRFMLYNLGGAIVWAGAHVVVGYLGGESWKVVGERFGQYSFILLVGVVALYYLIEHFTRKYSKV